MRKILIVFGVALSFSTFGTAEPLVKTSPVLKVDPKSPQAVHGVDSNNDGIRDSYQVAVHKNYLIHEVVELAMGVADAYKFLHELVLDDAIQVVPQVAINKLNRIIAIEDCFELLQRSGQIKEHPVSLYNDVIYRALYYRIGKRRLFEAMGSDYEAFVFEINPCPASVSLEERDSRGNAITLSEG